MILGFCSIRRILFDKIERRKITRCVRRGEPVWACRDLFAHGAGLGGIEGIGQVALLCIRDAGRLPR